MAEVYAGLEEFLLQPPAVGDVAEEPDAPVRRPRAVRVLRRGELPQVAESATRMRSDLARLGDDYGPLLTNVRRLVRAAVKRLRRSRATTSPSVVGSLTR